MNLRSDVSSKSLGVCVALINERFPIDVENKEELAMFFVDHACSIETSDPTSIGLEEFSVIKMRRTRSGAKSTKPFNIVINWKQLVNSAPAMVSTVLGSLTDIWMFFLAGLTLISQLRGFADIELTKHHAELVMIISENEPVSLSRVREIFTEKLTDSEAAESEEIFISCVCDLEKIKAIKVSDNQIKMVERIRYD
ncbi:hypothetical protein KC685_04920 [Candidatus Dojkabacteria bacterium]|uniref:Uncharacterized protein n=1 Tax=Candidatus Dojkabacteria bacterium TaxID=2099670 RepID=A0A955I2E3_9BACT|nr:hypothetical protein [Candidatus Dojkabacteria bacterium]